MRLKGVIGGLLGLELVFVLLWNSGFIGAEYGLPFAGPWTLLLWRYAALSGLLGVWLGAIDMAAPVGIIALVTALQPLLTGALSGLVVGERTGLRQWLGLILGFCGVAIAVGARLSLDAETPALGYLLPFGSVMGITAASLLQRRWALGGTRGGTRPVLPLDATLFYQSVATALALVLPAWLAEGFATRWTGAFVGTMAWLVVGVSLGAYWAMWRLLARQEATRVASLFYLSPPVTMLMAWVAFGDGVILTDLVGLAVAGAGVWLVYRRGAAAAAGRAASSAGS